MIRRVALCSVIALVALADPGAVLAENRAEVRGNCNITLVGSPGARATVVCNDRTRQIVAQIDKLSREGKLTTAEVRGLAADLNRAFLVIDQQDSRLAEIENLFADIPGGPGGAAQRMSQVRKYVTDVLGSYTQYVGEVRFTLREVRVGYGRVSFFVEVLNESAIEQFPSLFGGGSFGNGGSSLTINGQNILASQIDFGGKTMTGSVAQTIIPGVPLMARVDFNGVYLDPSQDAVFSLGHSYRNLKPKGFLRFKVGG